MCSHVVVVVVVVVVCLFVCFLELPKLPQSILNCTRRSEMGYRWSSGTLSDFLDIILCPDSEALSGTPFKFHIKVRQNIQRQKWKKRSGITELLFVCFTKSQTIHCHLVQQLNVYTKIFLKPWLYIKVVTRSYNAVWLNTWITTPNILPKILVVTDI